MTKIELVDKIAEATNKLYERVIENNESLTEEERTLILTRLEYVEYQIYRIRTK